MTDIKDVMKGLYCCGRSGQTVKKKLCDENGIKLFYYSDLGIDYPYEVYEDKDKLLEEIKKYGNS